MTIWSARTLEERLTEYRDSLLSMADQIEGLLNNLTEADVHDELVRDAQTSLRASVDLYRIIAGDDLTKLLNGEELEHFIIAGGEIL